MEPPQHPRQMLPPIPSLREPPDYKAISAKFAADSVRVLAELGQARDDLNRACEHYKSMQARLDEGEARFTRIEEGIAKIKTGFYDHSVAFHKSINGLPCMAVNGAGCKGDPTQPLIRSPMLLRPKKKLDLLSTEAAWGMAIGALMTLLMLAAGILFFWNRLRPQ